VNLMITMLLGGLWHGAGWTFVIWGGLHGVFLVINHAFHAVRKEIGWREPRFGRLGMSASVAFTFICVTAAWTVFRAPNFGTARRMLAGLCGLNGLSLPPNLRLSHAAMNWATAHGVVFHGLLPLTGEIMDPPWAVFFPAIGLAIAWLLPNTQEWMRLPGFAAPGETVPAPAAPPLLRWQPEWSLTGVIAGLILVLIVLHLAAGAPSEFLYFQF
jgi:hypothetical protein